MPICDGPSPTVQERFTAHAEARDAERHLRTYSDGTPMLAAQQQARQEYTATTDTGQGQTVWISPPSSSNLPRQEYKEQLAQPNVPWNVQKPPRSPIGTMADALRGMRIRTREDLQRLADRVQCPELMQVIELPNGTAGDVERVRDAPSLEKVRVVAEHRRAAFGLVSWLLAYLALAGAMLAVGRLF